VLHTMMNKQLGIAAFLKIKISIIINLNALFNLIIEVRLTYPLEFEFKPGILIFIKNII
jgi:hypothetical protein